MENINLTFINAITKANITREEYAKALHAYLTHPSRKTKATCYCMDCKRQ